MWLDGCCGESYYKCGWMDVVTGLSRTRNPLLLSTNTPPPPQTNGPWADHFFVPKKLESSHGETFGKHIINLINSVNVMNNQLLANHFLTNIVKIDVKMFSTWM